MGRLNRLTLFNRFRDPNVTANVHNWRQLASSHHNKAVEDIIREDNDTLLRLY